MDKTFETLLAEMAELTWMPLDAREQFEEMLKQNFTGSVNDREIAEGDIIEDSFPTEAEVKRFLVEENDWTEEDWDQFSGYYFRHINADGTTSLSRDDWAGLASKF